MTTARALRSVVLVLALIGCDRKPAAFNPSGLAGPTLGQAIPKPDFTLTATDGSPFNFRQQTEGKITLLFFGYTHCPDVCPVHLANIAAALQTLGPEVQRKVEVVFVTTDPDRDTPEVIRAWLNKFDPGFVGLRGSLAEVNAIQRGLKLGEASREPQLTPADTGYSVGHAALVLAFTPDDSAHVVYPFGVRQADWAKDLELLAKMVGPA
ncbi:MAG TPA: SCO family protein [Gemmatimonadales bacterium]|jgi:protein SCO1/2